jgi:uncharacterized protein (TIGR03083 family)
VAPAITAAEAFARAADGLLELLADLEPPRWQVPVLRELDVQGLVGHLVGVERDVQRALHGDPDVADADHVASTQPAADEQVGRTPGWSRDQLRAAVGRTLELVQAERSPGAVLSMHGMRLSLDALLVVRAFELWTHENDVRRCLGLPARAPDASTLSLMTALAVQLIPHAARRGQALTANVDLHLVLTGAGGGTWDLRLAAAPDDDDDAADLLLVCDAVDFCRLVADRIDPRELDLHVAGATAHQDGVLAVVASLALD